MCGLQPFKKFLLMHIVVWMRNVSIDPWLVIVLVEVMTFGKYSLARGITSLEVGFEVSLAFSPFPCG